MRQDLSQTQINEKTFDTFLSRQEEFMQRKNANLSEKRAARIRNEGTHEPQINPTSEILAQMNSKLN